MYEAYPLQWPAGYKKTNPQQRIWSRFKQTMDQAQRFLRSEIDRLGGKELIVSTNLRVRTDGGLYAADMNKKIDEPGVAIYFKYKGKQLSICCDQYLTVWENIYALAKGIEAIRGMERWGVSNFIERAFTGFAALPPSTIVPYKKSCWQILGIENIIRNDSNIRSAYINLSKKLHPDVPGGSTQAFQELTAAYSEALNSLQ